jgi:hypothetical protein
MLKFKLIPFIFLFVLASCEKDNENGNETMNSAYSDTESHNTGENCMNCHRSGGDGEGWFTVAGSVYDSSLINPYPNAGVKLYTGVNGSGSEVKFLEVDGKGNFYTTESIDFSSDLYVSVTDNNGNETFMISKLTKGDCNSCHGSSTSKIVIP